MSRQLKPEDLSRALRAGHAEMKRATERGTKRAARKLERELRADREVEDSGEFAKGWRLRVLPGGDVEVYNDAPHAGIVEGGARPHVVSREGREKIKQWVLRHGLAADERAADSIAWMIAEKIRREGSRAHSIVLRRLPKIVRDLKREVDRQLREQVSRR